MMEHDIQYELREKARQKYKPAKVKWLLVAEGPPEDFSRFFYFEQVRTHDYLYIETMHAIYFTENERRTGELRDRKLVFLARFRDDEYYLIDAVDNPIPQDTSRSEKRRIVKKGLPALAEKIKALTSEDTKVILISSTVYRLKDPLKKEGISVANRCAIPFPVGYQDIYRALMRDLLKSSPAEKTSMIESNKT